MAHHCRVGRNALDRVLAGAAGFEAIQRASRRGLGVREFEFSIRLPGSALACAVSRFSATFQAKNGACQARASALGASAEAERRGREGRGDGAGREGVNRAETSF